MDALVALAPAIVGVELSPTRLEAKRKLSQNRIAEDVAAVIECLGAGAAEERAVAAEIRQETPRT